MAGMMRFMIQIPAAVATMPTVLELSNPKSCRLIFPLKPSSAKAIVGTIANTKNITLTMLAASSQPMFTSNTCNNSTYWTTNTTYRQEERIKILVNSFQ